MEKPAKIKPSSSVPKKRKRKIKGTVSEPKLLKLEPGLTIETPKNNEVIKNSTAIQKAPLSQVMCEGLPTDDVNERYPILKNEELVKKFYSVPMTNNQKGRIRQILKDNLKGTSEILLPDVINNRIKAVLKSSVNLTDSDLRKLRILHNMLKEATKKQKNVSKKIKKVTEVKDKVDDKDKKIEKKKTTEKKINDTTTDKSGKDIKTKGPKRYVVFLGNLPLDIDKEKIKNHFFEMNEQIVDIRLPKRGEDKKSAIAYVELSNEPSFELALSKHHSMLGKKRINVLYTTQKNGKVTKAEAKGKAAKMLALQKSGKLMGSIPLNKKRSQRRKKMKQAIAKQAAAMA